MSKYNVFFVDDSNDVCIFFYGSSFNYSIS